MLGCCQRYAHEDYNSLLATLQDVAAFQERAVQFMLYVDRSVLHHVDRKAPLSLEYTPDLLCGYMQLLCNAVRILLLAEKVPGQLIVQLHTILHNFAQARLVMYIQGSN